MPSGIKTQLINFGERSIYSTAGPNRGAAEIGDETVSAFGSTNSISSAAFSLRSPGGEDGPAIFRLIQECPPLDINSAYCYLLQCSHFADTCVIAERDGVVVGWVSAYRLPADPETLFVWQVAVHESARGTGLGGCMLDHLIARCAPSGLKAVTATITASNAASWALFGSLARRRHARLLQRPMFERDVHFAGMHETEHLVSIALITSASSHQENT